MDEQAIEPFPPRLKYEQTSKLNFVPRCEELDPRPFNCNQRTEGTGLRRTKTALSGRLKHTISVEPNSCLS
ncbi:hypothetical protein J6590_017728 [Homalodisca vitripennis]|nr:hypothetical protein J6590_017728 [Homalodisca vitripennis]